MKVQAAQLPAAGGGDDRVFVSGHAVIVLDGASAFVPHRVPAATYAEQLGSALKRILTREPAAPLVSALRAGIADTAAILALRPGDSPSSTVTIVRAADDYVDVLTLGDNLVVAPDGSILDQRIERLELRARDQYLTRLASGRGYDDEHRAVLRELQTEQARYRNCDGGYWIAEANPDAAAHTLQVRRTAADTPWLIVATDGAYEPIRHLGLNRWPSIADSDTDALTAILERCNDWEAQSDPHGLQFPRAKVHDDKTLVAIRF